MTAFALSEAVKQHHRSAKIMKVTASSKETGSFEVDALPDEYRFDYSKAKPNRFAQAFEEQQIMVALDPDVAAIFSTPESVNRVLRALITTLPPIQLKATASVS
jgi:hypothetical protein